MGNPYPAGADSVRAVAKLYHVPLRRLRTAINQGECECPRQVGARALLTYAAIERWLESFPSTKSRSVSP